MLSIIGSLASPIVRMLLPGISPKLFYGIAVVLCVFLFAGFFYMKGAAGKNDAIRAEKAACDARFAKMEKESAESIASIMAEINNHIPEEPKTKKEELDLCRKSKLCRGD